MLAVTHQRYVSLIMVYFRFLLWMFWRLEQLLRKVQGKPVITLISERTPQRPLLAEGFSAFCPRAGWKCYFWVVSLSQ